MKTQTALLWKILRVVFSVGVFFLLFVFIKSNWSAFADALQIGWTNFLFVGILLSIFFFCSSAKFVVFYRALGAPVPILEGFALFMASGVFNFILPAQSGSAVRAIYLKRRYSLPYSQTPSILLGGLVVTFFIGGLLMLVANIAFYIGGFSPPTLVWFASFALLASIFTLWIRPPKRFLSQFGRLGELASLFFAGLEKIRADRKTLVQAGLWQGAELLLSGVTFWVAFASVGAKVGFSAGLSFAIFGSVLNTFFITPGNVGVLEAALGFISQIYAFTFVQGVAATAVVHGVGYIVYLLIAPLAYFFLNRLQPIRQMMSEKK